MDPILGMRRWKSRTRISCASGLVAAALSMFLCGCQRYEIETRVNADGSGHRKVTLEASLEGAGDLDISLDEFENLFGLDPARGWQQVSAEEGEDLIFTCEEDVASIADWAGLASGVHVRASLEEETFTGVHFEESVAVETGEGPEGRTVSYRARYEWREVMRLTATRAAEHFAEEAARQYPDLNASQLTELRGLLAGYLSMALLLEIDEECSIPEEAMTAAFAGLAEPVVRPAHPDAEGIAIAELAEEVIDGEWLDSFLEERLPGVGLTVMSEIVVRLRMPGRIVETNGEQVDANTVTWEIDMGRTISLPAEIYARAVVE